MRTITLGLFAPAVPGVLSPAIRLNDPAPMPPGFVVALVCRPVSDLISRVAIIECKGSAAESHAVRTFLPDSIGAPVMVSFNDSLAESGRLGAIIECCALEPLGVEPTADTVGRLRACMRTASPNATFAVGEGAPQVPSGECQIWDSLRGDKRLIWTVCTHSLGRSAYSPLLSSIEAVAPVARLLTPIIKAEVQFVVVGQLELRRA
jgi:hypothetical protein